VIFVPAQADAERVRSEDPDGGFPHDEARVIIRVRRCKTLRGLVPEERKGGDPSCQKEHPSPSPPEPQQKEDPHRRDDRDEHRPGCGEPKRGAEEEGRAGGARQADRASLPFPRKRERHSTPATAMNSAKKFELSNVPRGRKLPNPYR